MRRSIEIENLLKRIRETEAERDLAIKDRDNALKIANMNHAQWERAERERDAAVAALRVAEQGFLSIRDMNSHGADDRTYIGWLRSNADVYLASIRAALPEFKP